MSEPWVDNITSIEYCAGSTLVEEICKRDAWQARYMTETMLLSNKISE
jgi:hypothetical protein